jgi:hypothetical protein
MELKNYFAILRRWGWIMLLCTALAGITGYLYTSRQPSVYQSRSRYLIGPAFFPLYATVLKAITFFYLVPWLGAWIFMVAFLPTYRAAHPGWQILGTLAGLWNVALYALLRFKHTPCRPNPYRSLQTICWCTSTIHVPQRRSLCSPSLGRPRRSFSSHTTTTSRH